MPDAGEEGRRVTVDFPHGDRYTGEALSSISRQQLMPETKRPRSSCMSTLCRDAELSTKNQLRAGCSCLWEQEIGDGFIRNLIHFLT
jgi:hypothetical protein